VTLVHAREPEREQPVVAAALAFHVGTGSPAEVFAAVRRSLFYAQQGSASRPAAAVSMVAGWGTWIAVYTSLDRLAARVGACQWWSTIGADLLDNVLPELVARTGLAGIVVDLGSPHQLPLPCAMPVTSAPPPRAAGTTPAAGDREFSGRRWSA
jgi:predicted benzoate:H+ symporter BenE